jgi:hypothetical protein
MMWVQVRGVSFDANMCSMIVYLVVHRDRPHIALFQGTLEEAAGAIAAQPDPGELAVYANTGSFSRELTPEEQRELASLTDG